MSKHVSELQQMFPNIDSGVISMILDSADHDVERATLTLLEMSQSGESLPTQPQLHDTDFPRIQSSSKPSLDYKSSLLSSPKRPGQVSGQVSGSKGLKSSSLSSIGSKISSEPGDSEWQGWIENLKSGDKVMIIMRGLPGSGKSTLASRVVKRAGVGVILSTDDYFIRAGQYKFVPEELSSAHSFNQSRAVSALSDNVPLIIIDNTNTMSWEFKYYVEIAVTAGYTVHLLEPSTDWRFKPKMLADRNSHGVPRHKIDAMMERYERNLDIEKLISQWGFEKKSEVVETVRDEVTESSKDEHIEIFASDSSSEDYDESVAEVKDDAATSLNPLVNEFVPESSVESDIQPDNTEDITSLVNIFPHLTLEEVTEMYESQSINMKLDPHFADLLQSYFGSPAPPDYLSKLPQHQMLSMDISLSLAKIIFTIWQQNVLSKLNDDSLLSSDTSVSSTTSSPSKQINSFAQNIAPPPASVSTAKTVLAPNAVTHYENMMMNAAIKESLAVLPKKKPMIVLKDDVVEECEEFSPMDLESLIEERDRLYRKAQDTKGPHMKGAASYYAKQARDLNTVIKQHQKEQQKEMFLTINKGIPKTKIDLHYLQTGEAIKQLQHFMGQWETFVMRSRSTQSLEIVTGRGNRSEKGKSRLRPAVTQWLKQKNYTYSEVNDGCLRVTIRPK